MTQAYHSALSCETAISQMALLPLKTKTRGPAQVITDNSVEDIVDEVHCLINHYLGTFPSSSKHVLSQL